MKGGAAVIAPESEEDEAAAGSPPDGLNVARFYDGDDRQFDHRRSSVQGRLSVDGTKYIIDAGEGAELVTQFALPDSLMREMAKEIDRDMEAAGGSKKRATALNDRRAVKLVLLAAACAFVIMCLVYCLLPCGDPMGDFDGSLLLWVFVSHPFACVIVFGFIGVYFAALVNVPVPLNISVLSALAATGTFTAIAAVAGHVFGIYPVPLSHLVIGFPSIMVTLGSLIFLGYPTALLRDKNFRIILLRAFRVAILNIGLAFILVLYNAAFAAASGMQQSLLAVGLPGLKICVKFVSKWATSRGHNPGFTHGAGAFSEVQVNTMCAIVFTSIKDTSTFALLLVIDFLENLFYTMKTIAIVLRETRAVERDMTARAQQLRGVIRQASTTSMNVVEKAKRMSVTLELAKAQAGHRDSSPEHVPLPVLRRLLNDAEDLASAGTMGAANGTSGMSVDTLSTTASRQREHIRPLWRKCDDTTLHPQVAYTCGNLFMAESTEIIVPLVMALCQLAIFFNPLNDNRRYILFMNDKTEEQFLRGMLYVLADSVAEAVACAVFVVVVRKTTGADVLRVGTFLVRRHALCFLLVIPACCLFFLALFLEHSGCDTSFVFSWLDSGVHAPIANNTAFENVSSSVEVCTEWIDGLAETERELHYTCGAFPSGGE